MNELGPFVLLGAGGLGCPVGSALCAAGVGEIHVVDHDHVEVSNLQRQVLYSVADVGAPKAEVFARRLRARAPALQVKAEIRRLDVGEVDAWIAALPPESVVLECTDSPALKFAVNDAALRHDRVAVIGGALGWTGQAMAVQRGSTCYRCVFESPPPPELAPSCATAGVVGAMVGLIGHHMALLALRAAQARAQHQIEGVALESPAGRLLGIDGRTAIVRTTSPNRRPGCPACSAHLSERKEHGNPSYPHSAA